MKRLVLGAIALVMLLAPATAEAQNAPDKETAEKFFRAGEQAYKAGQYLIAAQAFEEALKSFPVPAIVFSTAQAYRLQYFIDKDPGWLKRSIELYRRYVSEVEQGGRRDDATASLAELEPILGRIEAEQTGPITTRAFVPATQILVNTQLSGARASIDGVAGDVPLVRKVEPGQHKVRVEADGYFPVEQTVVAVEGRLLPVEIELKPMPATLNLRTNGEEVSIDGRPYRGSYGNIRLSAGKHFVTVRRRGHRSYSREVVVTRGQKLELDASLETTTQRKLSWWVMGGGGAFLVLGGLSGLGALGADGDASDLEEKRQNEGLTPAELEELFAARDDRDSLGRSAWILAGIGAGVAVTGVLMMVFDNPSAEAPPVSVGGEATSPERSPLSVVPVIGPDIAGFAVGGRF